MEQILLLTMTFGDRFLSFVNSSFMVLMAEVSWPTCVSYFSARSLCPAAWLAAIYGKDAILIALVY